jgi:hypothetical protein
MIKSIDRRSCGLIKASQIDADNQRRAPIGLKPLVRDKKARDAAAPMKVAHMDPAAVEELLQRDAREKNWGNRIRPVKARRQVGGNTTELAKQA